MQAPTLDPVIERAQLPWERPVGTIARQTAAALARRIVTGEIPTGEILTEVGIANSEHISRTPVREAMLELQRWGLVRLLPKKGAVVVAPGFESARDLLATRELFEEAGLERALRTPDLRQELLEELDSNLVSQHRAIDAGDRTEFACCDVKFHLLIIGANGNSIMTEIMDSLAPRFALLIHRAIGPTAAEASALVADHERLRDAIASGDLTESHHALHAHVLGRVEDLVPGTALAPTRLTSI